MIVPRLKEVTTDQKVRNLLVIQKVQPKPPQTRLPTGEATAEADSSHSNEDGDINYQLILRDQDYGRQGEGGRAEGHTWSFL